MNPVSDTAVTDPQAPVTRLDTPIAQDQTYDRLPWRRIAKVAALAFGGFALAAAAAVVLLYSANGTVSDDRAIATKQVHAEQIGIVEPRLIERETRASELAARRRKQLQEWGWVDRDKNIVRMPIDRAMQQVVEGKR